jgi:hypothetical protein
MTPGDKGDKSGEKAIPAPPLINRKYIIQIHTSIRNTAGIFEGLPIRLGLFGHIYLCLCRLGQYPTMNVNFRNFNTTRALKGQPSMMF